MRIRRTVAGLAALGASLGAAAAESPKLTAAFTSKVLQAYTPQEVEIVSQPFVALVGERLGRTTGVRYCKTVDDALFAARRGEVQFIFSDAVDYVRVAARHPVRPLVTCSVGFRLPATAAPVVLVVRADSGLGALGHLQGKALAVAEEGDTVAHLFLEEKLRSDGLPPPSRYFSRLVACDDQNGALDLVVGHKADVACVSREVLRAKARHDGGMKDKLLTILESKAAYPVTIAFCLEDQVEKALADAVQRELLTVHESPEGELMLVFFKMGRFVEPSPGEIEAVRELVERVDRLRKGTE